MKEEIKVPQLGESITEATVGSILKSSGSYVNNGEEIIELETEKVNQVLYAPAGGLLSLNISLGSSVTIGQVLGTIDTEAKAAMPQEKEKQVEKKKDTTSSKEKEENQEIGRVRQTAEEYVASLKHPEKEKSIKEEVLQKSHAAAVKEEKRETRRRMSTIRKVIASRMVEAKQTTAMLTTFNEVDMSQIMAIRENNKEAFQKKYGSKLGFMSFFVKACVSALQVFPELNSFIDGEEIVQREYYDIGVAVGTVRGLVVPVVRNCEQLSFAEIEQAIEQYAKKAREEALIVDDLRGGGFTITNGGVYGSLLSTPILNPPQSGILGMHKIEKRPVVINDEIVIRSMMYVALSYDHRIVDGKEAVGFLVHVKKVLEDPIQFIL